MLAMPIPGKLPTALTLAFAGLLGSMATLHATAQEPVQIQPAPLLQEGRFFPGFGNEGMIVARYTIKADGTTDDIEIVGGFTNDFYEKSIKDAIAKWTFTPGTVNGAPAAFLNQEYVFRIKIAEELASSPDFQEEFAKLDVQLTAQEYEDSKKTIRGMLRQNVHTVLDYAVTNQMLSRIELQMGDPFAALAAIKLSTMSSVNAAGETEYMLTPDLLQGSLRQQVVLAASVRQQGEVLRAWEVLNANFDIPADDRLHELVTTAQQQVESPDPLPGLAKIIEDQWTYAPVHRIFTVADIAGELEKITARCEHRNLELEYQPDVDWTLPPALGKCTLDFEGKDGTTFTVYEFKE
jgi:TonB family protein